MKNEKKILITQNSKDYLKSNAKESERETVKAIYNHLNVNGFISQLQKG